MLPHKKLRMTCVPEPHPCFPEQGSRMGTFSALFSPAQSLCFFPFFFLFSFFSRLEMEPRAASMLLKSSSGEQISSPQAHTTLT